METRPEVFRGRPTGGAADRPLFRVRRSSRRRADVVLTVAVVWIVILLILAVTVQWLPLHSYLLPAGRPDQGPNMSSEFFGTDASGRSVLSRVLFGARISLLISFVATAISFAVGALLGLCSAYFGRVVRNVDDVIANSILSIPHLLLLMAIVLALGRSVTVITIACSIIYIPAFMRLTYATASTQLVLDYVVAARGLGASSSRIIFLELLPNTAPSLISYAALVLPAVMITEGSLSFLGFGIQSPTPSWGNMIGLGAQTLSVNPWESIIPCIFLFVTVYALNTIGDHMRKRIASADRSS